MSQTRSEPGAIATMEPPPRFSAGQINDPLERLVPSKPNQNGHTSSKPKLDFSNLWHARLIVRCPTWRLQMKDAEVRAQNANGEKEVVTGKTTRPCFKLDSHKIFTTLSGNDNRANRLLKRFTVTDVEDGLRLIPETAIAEFSSEADDVIREREQIATEMDAVYPEIVESIREQFPEHFWQIKGRLPLPPFKDRLEVIVRLREITGAPTDRLISASMSPEKRQRIMDRLSDETEKMVHARVEAIVDGVMNQVADLAQEIDGTKPNPDYDPLAPIGPKNLQFLPGINSGHKKTGFLENLLDNLTRVMNFKQFLTPDIIS